MELVILGAIATSAAVNVCLLVLLKQMSQNHHDHVMNELEGIDWKLPERGLHALGHGANDGEEEGK